MNRVVAMAASLEVFPPRGNRRRGSLGENDGAELAARRSQWPAGAAAPNDTLPSASASGTAASASSIRTQNTSM